jgi:hypothetical protein
MPWNLPFGTRIAPSLGTALYEDGVVHTYAVSPMVAIPGRSGPGPRIPTLCGASVPAVGEVRSDDLAICAECQKRTREWRASQEAKNAHV